VYRIAALLGGRVVLKAQVLTGGRGTAGGIRLAKSAEEARSLAGKMFGMRIGGYPASKILIDKAIEFEHEYYVGIAIDRRLAQPVIVASTQGGVDIAEVARDAPERVYRFPIDPLLGLRAYQVRALADELGLAREWTDDFVSLALGLYNAFADCEATLVEANPLVADPGGAFCCLNCKVVVDDHALYRHRDLMEMWDESQEMEPERLARRQGITYVRLGGHVGCLSNGAGLAMATTDLLRSLGVRPANFCDVGKEAGVEAVIHGLRLARNNSVEAVLVNVFCSVTSCVEVARGIVRACQELDFDVPLVVRLEGVGREEGHAVLAAALQVGPQTDLRSCIHVAASLDGAAQVVLGLVQGANGAAK
jgi:succinyl-CoA synthetase beta subunit